MNGKYHNWIKNIYFLAAMLNSSDIESLIKHERVYRYVGAPKSKAMIGGGFMQKAGWHIDMKDAIVTHYSLIYVIRGSGIYHDHRGRKYPLKPGSIFQRFSQHRHSTFLDPASNWAECFVLMDNNTQQCLERFGLIERSLPVFFIGIHAYIIRRFDNIFQELKEMPAQNATLAFAKIAHLLADLKMLWLRANLKADDAPLLASVRQILESSIESREKLPELLRSVGINYEYMRKIFQRQTGISPIKHLIRRRIESACAMLMDKSVPLKTIAEKLGYPSPYAFSAQFNKFMGVSPLQFRHHTEN